ncbi:MAG TPA: chloride channel protein [Planctomycetaceae bacterium]|jgi:CIC family chloride channel protein|nr:chloride channel protein [Planctomycetaceae bacterium]
MIKTENAHSATTGGLTISPSLDLVSQAEHVPPEASGVDRRTVKVCLVAILLGVLAAFVAKGLILLIDFITNFAFFHRLSVDPASPGNNTLGIWVIAVPVIGGLFVGFMARYGSKAIRGHGIPEAMEGILTKDSRIPARMTFLKPLSAAISIGTGGPFGAEGPIIATGGALGSLFGQFTYTTPSERKTLLAAGAAAGMAGTFGSPVAAVLLALELLLFEFRARSIIPVALASAAAAGIRPLLFGHEPVFAMGDLSPVPFSGLAFYAVLGLVLGLVAAGINRLVYAIEDSFDHLPIHWMWWPALGAVAVGTIGYFYPDTLGVGYYNIRSILDHGLAMQVVVMLCLMKFLSWSISLGSGTSGGTLAPLLTIGAGSGQVLGAAAMWCLPFAGIDLRLAALVGMAATFAGASRAFLASAVFAFETTCQPNGLLPLLAGCAASYLVASLAGKHSIMTEKIARRGIRTPADYVPDPLEQVTVDEIASKPVVTLPAADTVSAARAWMATNVEAARHQGFPIVDTTGILIGVLTRRDLQAETAGESQTLRELLKRPAKFVYEDCTVRQAADHMVNHNIGRLPVVLRDQPTRLIGIVTRSDILSAYRRRIKQDETQRPAIRVSRLSKKIRRIPTRLFR